MQELCSLEERYLRADDVIITHQLSERPSRAPDFAAENQALQALATELAERPENLRPPAARDDTACRTRSRFAG